MITSLDLMSPTLHVEEAPMGSILELLYTLVAGLDAPFQCSHTISHRGDV